MGQHFTSNTSLNWLFVDLVWSISRDRPCHHNPICKGNLCPRLWNNKNGIESTVSSKMTAKLVVRHKSEKWKLWMPQFLRTVKQIFYPQISVSRIDVGVLDHASGCIVYYKTWLQKYGSWSVSRNLNIKPLLPIPTIKTVILCTVIKYRGWFHCYCHYWARKFSDALPIVCIQLFASVSCSRVKKTESRYIWLYCSPGL